MLSRSAFSPDHRASDGLQSACRECCNLAHRAKYAAAPELARKTQREYNARNRERIRVILRRSVVKHRDRRLKEKRAAYRRERLSPEFKEKRRRYQASTKDRKRTYDRVYRLRHSARLHQKKQRWRESNQDLVREIRRRYKLKRRQVEIVGDDARVIAEWVRGLSKRCFWCDVLCDNGAHQVDHFVPLSRGGSHTICNIVISCPPCNVSKNGCDPEEFAARRGLDWSRISLKRG